MATAPVEDRILITGARGFVGAWVVKEVERRYGKDAVVAFEHRDGTAEPVDILDRAETESLLAFSRPTAVIHLAAISEPAMARADPSRAWEVNVFGTLNLALAVMDKVPAARFLYVGSSEAYGASFETGSPLRESASLQPTTVYGSTKAAADLMIGQLSREGLKALRFRPFNHAGPGQPNHFVISSFCEQVARIEAGVQPPVLHVGNISVKRDFLDVRDVARAYVDAATNEVLPVGAVINLATGSPASLSDIIDMLRELATVPFDVETDPARVRQNELQVASGDPALALRLLSWRPRIAIEQTLRDVLDFWRGTLKST